jgi:hypothetical protein
MTVRTNDVESLILVAAFIGLFVLALVCLAYSMSGRELFRCSVSRSCCCCCCWGCGWFRRRRHDEDNHHDDIERRQQSGPPPSYENINEFIFQSDSNDSTAIGVLTMDNGTQTPTTMQQLFPDLLGTNSHSPPPQGGRSFFTSPSSFFRRNRPVAGGGGGVSASQNDGGDDDGQYNMDGADNDNNYNAVSSITQTTNAELREPLL